MSMVSVCGCVRGVGWAGELDVCETYKGNVERQVKIFSLQVAEKPGATTGRGRELLFNISPGPPANQAALVANQSLWHTWRA